MTDPQGVDHNYKDDLRQVSPEILAAIVKAEALRKSRRPRKAPPEESASAFWSKQL